ncbi:MAG TPA: adenylate/guanylate cyclase domain-containing protein [Methylomirabilota bacterium]|nr:adenylate/guanylate cyclase domain-containing protein [Methylomirabilota bacterium]
MSAESSPPAHAPAAPLAAPSARSIASYTPKHLADKVLKARSAIEGERRQVTVLFADIAGFTSLAEGRDPEEIHQLVDRCFEAITAEVHRFEGTINQYTGDGVMALFGAPIAHEDSARRAVHAALGIQRALRDLDRELRPRLGGPLEMRIGINSGPVVVGRIGDDLRMDYTAVGDTTNLAARLQQAARPGSVLVGEPAYRLVGGFFEMLDLGELPVKGHAEIRAWEVLRARGRRARLDVAAERGLTPLVGRGRELSTLLELFRKVRAGNGQVVCIAGEAGIGKSRLLLEMRRQLAEANEHVTWLEGRCVSFGESIPFLPMTDQLRESFRIEEFDGEPEIIAKIEHAMRRMGQLEPHIPYIRYLLAVDPGDPAVAAMDGADRRKRMFDASLALTVRGAQLQPLVLVFEDLHWVDTSTEEYLRHLIDSAPGVSLMVIVTYRVGYTPPFGSRTFQTALTIDALDERESMTMAARVLGSAEFPEALRAALTQKAEGVPLFVEEVTKTLLDLGVLRRDNGGYRMVQDPGESRVPDTIQGIIMARLDRLGDDGKRTVQLASVIGRQFLRRLLERIAGLTGQLEGLLGELKALEIIYERGLLQEPAYVFKHAVIQDVAYQSLLVQRRRELHRAVGLAIEELYPERLDEHLGELAHHFAQAEDWARAMDYGLRAGNRAMHAFSNVEARRHLERAIACAGRLEAPPALHLAQLNGRLGGVLVVLGEWDASAAAYERGLVLARQTGDRSLEAELLIGLSSCYSLAHRAQPALEIADAVVEVAREIGDGSLQSFSLGHRAWVLSSGRGQIRESLPDLEEALRLSDEIRDPRRLAHVLIMGGGCALEWQGAFDRALPVILRGLEVAERHHLGLHLGAALFLLGHLHASRGDYEEAYRFYRRLADYGAASGDRTWLSRSPNSLGGVHLELWDLEQAITLCEEGDDVARRFWHYPEPRGHSLVKLGLAHLRRGDHARAHERFTQASALLDVDDWLRWRWHMALLHALGELALAEGRGEDAWRFASESRDLAERCDSRKHVARARQLQGEVLAAGNRLVEARNELEASVALAEHLGTSREIWMGRAALGKVLDDLGRDKDAEAQFDQAARTIEAVAAKLTTPGLRRSFLGAAPVVDIFQKLGRRPPAA